MNFWLVLIAAAPLIIDEALAATKYLNCSGSVYESYPVEQARERCAAETSELCKIVCAYKQLGAFNDNNESSRRDMERVENTLGSAFGHYFSTALLRCAHHMKSPSQQDSGCSEYSSFVQCQSRVIEERCDIIAPSIFLDSGAYLNRRFNASVETARSMQESSLLSIKELLKLYGLYKQSTAGDLDLSRPRMNLRTEATWDAWNAVRGTSMDQAKEQHIALVEELREKHPKAP